MVSIVFILKCVIEVVSNVTSYDENIIKQKLSIFHVKNIKWRVNLSRASYNWLFMQVLNCEYIQQGCISSWPVWEVTVLYSLFYVKYVSYNVVCGCVSRYVIVTKRICCKNDLVYLYLCSRCMFILEISRNDTKLNIFCYKSYQFPLWINVFIQSLFPSVWYILIFGCVLATYW